MRVVVGVMTGTSIDGIDTVVAGIEGDGLLMRARMLLHRSDALGAIADGLRRAARRESMSDARLASLALQLGTRFADVVAFACDAAGLVEPDLVSVHGQTIVHRPPVSVQLVDPEPIADRLRCPVVYDLRQADLAAGGQGAPITPLADWVLFRDAASRRAVVNLGGFCNATIVTPDLDGVRGFDVCVCNHVLDAAARTRLDAPYDDGGRAALAGRADHDAAAALRTVLDAQHAQQRSLGTGDEAEGWVEAYADRLAGPDLAATAVEAIGNCIAAAIREHEVGDIVLAGGGSRNRALVDAIRRATPGQQAAPGVVLSDQSGVPVEAREALAMAVLGALSADGVPITLPQVTGCSAPAPVAGRWCEATASGVPRPAS